MRLKKMPGGRPTKYDPRYCEEVLEAARGGYSLTAFAGMLEVARSTINEWIDNHPEFSEACKKHGAVRTQALEEGLLNTDIGARITARIFALKNAAPEEWQDRRQHEHSGPNGRPIETIAWNDQDLAKALVQFMDKV
jgi:hypothetical protein